MKNFIERAGNVSRVFLLLLLDLISDFATIGRLATSSKLYLNTIPVRRTPNPNVAVRGDQELSW